MVGLHVVYDDIVQRSPVQHKFQILKELAADGQVHRVEQDGFFVQQDVGVVAHALGDGVDVFKQSQPPVAGTDPVQIVLNFFDAVHTIPPENKIGMILVFILA